MYGYGLWLIFYSARVTYWHYKICTADSVLSFTHDNNIILQTQYDIIFRRIYIPAVEKILSI